ncbi:DUF4097 family beta strand repeat-containing protein [uncultured Draconibacterium sp.]|uniref:DUF4097 family beta strand repeat-containing protein n=1 Tax=uncultured Draconibacterium sp. TaxID=1573823 RepID=UPI0032180EC2
MKRITILLVIFVLPLVLFSQENKFEYTPKVKNKIEVSDLLGKIMLKNTTGNTIVIESDFNLKKPDRADGLMLLGAAEDNTGLGVNLIEENGVVTIIGVTKKVKDHTYTISIPDGIAVNIDYHSPFANGDLEIDSYKGSLELKTLAAGVKLTNCTGPFTVSSISGDIEAVFGSLNQEQPTSLASVSGLVDVTLPASIKANIQVSNITGDVYNNLDLKNSSKQNDERSDGLNEIKHRNNSEYTLNGGGQKLFLKSVSGNIYLRKK